jgi:hypothetical protein
MIGRDRFKIVATTALNGADRLRASARLLGLLLLSRP